MWERNSSRSGALVVALLAGGVSVACGSSRPGGGAWDFQPSAVLEVENHNWHDAKVYVASSTQRVRLGTVRSQGTARFLIPGAHLRPGGVRLEVSLLASNDMKVTEQFLVRPGDQVDLTVRNKLSLTSFAVYGR